MLRRACLPSGSVPVELWPPTNLSQRMDTILLDCFTLICFSHCLLFTEVKYLDISPESYSKGDADCIMHKAKVPLILRPKNYFIEDGQNFPFLIEKKWQLTREAYVYDIMNGEWYSEDKIEEFHVVKSQSEALYLFRD